MLIDKKIRREAHVDISAAVCIRVFEENAKAVRQNIEIKGVFPEVGFNLDLVFHCQGKKYHVLVLIPLYHLIELWQFAVADLASRRPKREYNDLALQLAQIKDLAVKRFGVKIRGRRARPQALLCKGRSAKSIP